LQFVKIASLFLLLKDLLDKLSQEVKGLIKSIAAAAFEQW
jgi:hypothetical protein